jgi:cell division protein FtsW (lipid II flippase)
LSFTEWIQRAPRVPLICTALLIFCGTSAIARADELLGLTGLLQRQLIWVLLASPVLIGATLIPYRQLRTLSYGLFGLTIVLLSLTYFMPIRNGARRWIPLGFMDFQPSEIAKLTFIMALAHYLMYRKNYRRLTGLVVPFVITMVPMFLILRQPDLGTSLLFVPVLFSMLFAAGARFRHLATIILLGVAMVPVLWIGMSSEQRSRITTVFTQRDGGTAPTGDGYHLHQSKQILAFGGISGSRANGNAIDDPDAYHLPAAREDFIFCLMGEQWGLVGCIAVLGLYCVLCASGLRIAASTQEPFGRLLAVGIVTLLCSQAVINTGMTVGLMPITGMTLPLASYGGSSLVSTCLAIGLLLNVGMRPGYEIAPEPFRF